MVTSLTNPISQRSAISQIPRGGRVGLTTLALAAGMFCLPGCRKSTPESKETPAAASTAPSTPSAPDNGEKNGSAQGQALGSRLPIGPHLIVVPGRGFGPIRFGATFETVERLMGFPCEVKSETRCLYIRQAIDFAMKDGVVVGMKAQMRDRPVEGGPPNADKAFGSFRGVLPPKIMMGLHRHIVLEEFGEPERKEPVAKPPALGLVDRHFYDGLILEYDKIENGNVVLASIEVVRSETAPPAGPKNVPAEGSGAAVPPKAVLKK